MIDIETHRAVFTWVLQGWWRGLAQGQDRRGRRDHAGGERRHALHRAAGQRGELSGFLTGLAQASGIETPTRAELARLDRKRKKKPRMKIGESAADPDAQIAKMKDGRTHLAHKAEHAVDLETGALVAVTLQDADQGDTTTIIETVIAAAEQIEDAQAAVQTPQRLGRDHRGQGLSQQSDYDRAGGRRPPVLRGGAGPWSPRLVRGARRPAPGVCQSAAASWREKCSRRTWQKLAGIFRTPLYHHQPCNRAIWRLHRARPHLLRRR